MQHLKWRGKPQDFGPSEKLASVSQSGRFAWFLICFTFLHEITFLLSVMKRKPWNEEDKDKVENPIDHTYLAHSCFKTNYLKWNMTPKSLLLYNSSCRHDIIWCGDLPLLNGLLVLDPHIPLHWHFMKPFADRAHISVPLSKDLKMQQLSRHKTSYVGVSTSPKTITSSLKIFYIF